MNFDSIRPLATVVARRYLPSVVKAISKAERILLSRMSRRRVFEYIVHQNRWGEAESRSGRGSSLGQTHRIREELPVLLEQIGSKSLLDIPCGDFAWMRLIAHRNAYIGADIVESLITTNQARYGDDRKRFVCLDLVNDSLPAVDVVLCRDCLVHLSYADIAGALANIKASGSKYLLATTFTGDRHNSDIYTGGWRPLNLQKRPFAFPAPLYLLREECPDPLFADKALGLWLIEDLPVLAA
jgi:hypothetical protein